MANGAPVPVTELFRGQMGSRLRQGKMVVWELYDTETYTSGTTTQLNFFRTVKTSLLNSNMKQAGSLPWPQAFHCYAICIVPLIEPGALLTTAPNALTDLYRLLFNSYCEFKIEEMSWGVHPSFVFPAGAGILSAIGGAGGEAADEFVINAVNGIPSPRDINWMNPPVQIEPVQKFEFNMHWDATQTLTANQDVKVVLRGHLIRSVQ